MPLAGMAGDTPFFSDQLFRIQKIKKQRDRHLRWLSRLSAVFKKGARQRSWMTCQALRLGSPPHRGNFRRSCPNFCCQAVKDWVSTRTPTPMVDDTAILRRYTPLLDAGLALVSASTSAARLPWSLSLSNERRPMVE